MLLVQVMDMVGYSLTYLGSYLRCPKVRGVGLDWTQRMNYLADLLILVGSTRFLGVSVFWVLGCLPVDWYSG